MSGRHRRERRQQAGPRAAGAHPPSAFGLDRPALPQDGGEPVEQSQSVVTAAAQQGTASASMLQRRLRIGYNRAARLIETMEDEGIIGPADGSKVRPVIDSEDWND